MSDKDDITRIEDLSEFLHNEDEEFKSLEELAGEIPEEPTSSSDEGDDLPFTQQQTDPTMSLPESSPFDEDDQSFDSNEEVEVEEEDNFGNEEIEEPSFEENSFPEETFEEEPAEFNADFAEDFETEDSDFDTEDEASGFESTEFQDDFDDATEFETQSFESDSDEFEDINEDSIPEIELTDEDDFSNDNDFDSPSIEAPEIDLPEIPEAEVSEVTISAQEEIGPEELELTEAEPEGKIELPVEIESAQDDLSDLTKVQENLFHGSQAEEGNPPFSIKIENIKYIEDAEAIASILVELQIVQADEKEQLIQSLQTGRYLVSRVSEYVGILLCHKIRRFHLDYEMGLTHEINPPKSYDSDDSGLVSKKTVYRNKKHFLQFSSELKITDIIATTLSSVPRYEVLKYGGMITAVKLVNEDNLKINESFENELNQKVPEHELTGLTLDRIKSANLQAVESLVPDISSFQVNYYQYKKDIEFTYNELIEELKTKALEHELNAVVGIQFQITPVHKNSFHDMTYQITATGNLAWIQPE